MTEVSTHRMGAFTPGRLDGLSYFPSTPPKPPNASISYSRAMLGAPFTALVGVVVDGRHPDRHPVTPRCRVRHQVGYTNRWRLPESLGSDLLGTAQALKAIRTNYSKSVIGIITAENPRAGINVETESPYSFKASKSPGFQAVQKPTSAPPRLLSTTPLSRGSPYIPTPSRPLEIFYYHSKRGGNDEIPVHLRENLILECMGLSWEIHRPYAQKSETLSQLIDNSEAPSLMVAKYYKNKSLKLQESEKETEEQSSTRNVPKLKEMLLICLEITDPLVTPEAFAVALGNLYHDNIDVEVSEVVAVLAAACALRVPYLENGCAELMVRNINATTVCDFHKVASKYNKEKVKAACEKWLEINLVSQLSSQLHLKHVTLDLLIQIVTSNRLFIFNEFSLYKTLAMWVYLQFNPSIQIMPRYSAAITFFNSLSKDSALLDREEGEHYASLFMAVRLHGITESNHIQDIQTMNIIPQSWIVKALSQHYHSLQGGGDMSIMMNFNTSAIRNGFIIDEEPHYHSEILSLHGFHFELKAVRQNKQDVYSFFIQRLRPGDPVLSFRHSERHTFSMRPEREVKYSMRVQFYQDGQVKTYHTGQLSHCFGLGEKTSKGQVLTMENLSSPIYVSFAVLFPPS